MGPTYTLCAVQPVRSATLAGEDLLARVWLRALSAVAGAVVVQILALFQLTDEEAAAVAALHQPRESEIVLHLPGLVLRSRIQ